MTGYAYVPVIVFCRCCFGYNVQFPRLIKPWLALVTCNYATADTMPCPCINQSHHHTCSLCLTNQILLPTPLDLQFFTGEEQKDISLTIAKYIEIV